LTFRVRGSIQSECAGEDRIKGCEFVDTRDEGLACEVCGKSMGGNEGCGVVVSREAGCFSVAGSGVASVDAARADSHSRTESSDGSPRTGSAVSGDPKEIEESAFRGEKEGCREVSICLHCCTSGGECRCSDGTEGLRESHDNGGGALLQGWVSQRDGAELHCKEGKKRELRSTEHIGVHDDEACG
jgi:hypothetical protein